MFTMLEISKYNVEIDAHSYFRWILNKWEISFYKQRNGLFQFTIDLPFIHITNTMVRRHVNPMMNPENWDKDPTNPEMSVTVHAVTTGNVFGWKNKIL